MQIARTAKNLIPFTLLILAATQSEPAHGFGSRARRFFSPAPYSPPPAPAPVAPSPPSSLNAQAANASSIQLTWQHGGNSLSGFILEKSTSSTFSAKTTFSLAATARSFQDNGLAASTRYYYRLQAVNGGLLSHSLSASAATSAAPAPATPPPPAPPATPAPSGAVELGSSGTAPSGNRVPNFNGHQILRNGYYKEFARPVTSDPVDPNSEKIIQSLLAGTNLHVDWSTTTANGGNSMYGMPINIVPGNQPMVPVIVGSYAAESDGNSAPIPANPSVENWYSPTGKMIDKAGMQDGGDHHMLIGVRNETTGNIDTLYEMYQVYYEAGKWHAANIAKFDLAGGKPRQLTWTSGDAAGLPMLPLLIRYDEAHNNAIHHAIRFQLDAGQIRNQYVWPARHSALSGRFDAGIPFGARLRLKKSWYDANKGSFTREARAIVDAMFTYGMIQSDIGGKMFFQAVNDERWDKSNILSLQTIPATAFEMLKLVPLWSVTGPACVELGKKTAFQVSHYPLDDVNVNKGIYMGLNGDINSSELENSHVTWNAQNGNSGTFYYTPKVLGTHVIKGQPGGEYYYPPEDTVVTVKAKCN